MHAAAMAGRYGKRCTQSSDSLASAKLEEKKSKTRIIQSSFVHLFLGTNKN